MRANLKQIKTWSWYKKMPTLMQELFNDIFNEYRGVRITKSMAEDKYLEIMALAQEIN